MKRAALLHELTGIMGDALKALRDAGTPLDERSISLWADAVIDRYKALPELPAAKLADSVNDDEVNHGGLLSRSTLHLANAARRRPPKEPKSPVDLSDI